VALLSGGVKLFVAVLIESVFVLIIVVQVGEAEGLEVVDP